MVKILQNFVVLSENINFTKIFSDLSLFEQIAFSDFKILANSWSIALNFKSFSQSLEHFFIVCQNKIPKLHNPTNTSIINSWHKYCILSYFILCHPLSESCKQIRYLRSDRVVMVSDARGHSTTTWTEFWPPPSPFMDSVYTLRVDKNRHFLTPLILST